MRIHKRRRVGGLLALAVAIGMSGTYVADASTPDDEESGPVDEEATVVGLFGSQSAAQLDPHAYQRFSDFQVMGMIYDGLVQFGREGEIEPLLAESWEFNEEGTALEFTLHPGAVFHDGSPIDAEAIKANFERALTWEESTVAERLSAIESVDVVDELIVRLNVGPTAGNLLEVLAGPDGLIVGPPSDDMANDPGTALSGPYQLVSFEPGGITVLDRFADYWDPEFQGPATIESSPTQDVASRILAIRSGDAHIGSINGIDYDQLQAEVEAGDELQMELFDHPTHLLFYFNRESGPFAELRVRQAVMHAIELDEAARAVFGETAYAAEGILPTLDVESPYNYDPERARELLEEAGVGDGFSFNTACFDANFCRIAQVIQEQLSEIGVDMEISQMTAADQRALEAEGGLDSAIEGISPLPTSSARIQELLFSPGLRFSEFGEGAEQAEEIRLRSLDQTLSPDELEEVYAEMNDLVFAEELWYAPLIYYYNAVLSTGELNNIGSTYNSGAMNLRVVTVDG